MDLRGLTGICTTLGVAKVHNGDRTSYSPSETCSENLRDLLRFLRRDDPQTRDVFKLVCKWKTVSKDLIPIIQYCQNDRSLVLNAVKVLVFLTMPIEPSSSDIPQQIECLWDLKFAVTNSETIVVIVSLLETPLENLEREAFTEDDWKLVQLVLTFFRNVLAIQDISLSQKVGYSVSELLSLRDRFLELLFQENVMDLIIVLTQHVGGSYSYLHQDNLLLLEIFHYIFMCQDPQLIANVARLKDSKACGGINVCDGLKSIMEAEEEKRKLSRLRNLSRHSQFSGTFTRFTMDGSKAVYKGNPSSASQSILHKPQKVHRGPTKRIMWDHGTLPSVKDNILELLHDFLTQFLSGGYNVLMESVRKDIEKEQNAIQKSDVMVFIQVAQFVTSFQYHKYLNSKPNVENHASQTFADTSDSTLFKGNICGPIAATMNESMFVLVISKWRYAFDGLKETNDHKFLSASGSLMKTMIRILDLILKLLPEDSKEPQTARILLYKLFYDQTDEGMTHFILSQIKSFDTHKQSKSDLADLVETVHVMVRLMENLQGRGTLRVSKKSRKIRKKKKPSNISEAGNELQNNEANIQDQNPSCHTEKSRDSDELPQKGQENATSDNHQEMNTTTDVEVDAPKKSVPEMGNVSFHIDNSGDLDVSPQKSRENSTYYNQQAMNSDVEVDAPEKSVPETGNGSTLPREGNNDHLDDLSCSSDGSSGDEQPAATYEVDFKVSTFVSAFANHSIIRNLCWLLRLYKSNPVSTNHYIICILQRITDDLNLAPMLYQLSLLTKFHEILVEQESCPSKEYLNIVDFLTTLVRRMLRKMKNQPLLFVEILFWKSRRECQYINAEYLLHELKGMRKETSTWGNNSTNGEYGSSEARGWAPRSLADALGDDEADVVISHDLGLDESDRNEQRDNASVSNSSERNAEEMGGKTVGAPKRKRRLVLTDELETQIKELYEKFKDEGNCSKLIAESLDPDGLISPAQVFNKLKQLGLEVASRKRMRHVDRSNSTNLGPSGEKGSDLPTAVNLEENFPRESSGKRKRVRAFSKDHEERIKVLFEQFKDHKKCNHMIANALAADNSVTAAQVSRKLKQLGLRVPRGKKSQADKHLRDEDSDDASVEHNSDNEVLLSRMNRSQKTAAVRLSDDEIQDLTNEGISLDSDDDLLSNLLPKKKTQTNKHLRDEDPNDASVGEHNSDDEGLSRMNRSKKTAAGRLSNDEIQDLINEDISQDSDDDLPRNLLPKKKSRAVVHLRDEDLNIVPIGENNSDDEILLSLRNRKSRKTLPKENQLESTTKANERKATDENSEMPDKVIGFDHVSKQESSKAEISESPSQASPVQNPLDQIDDALDDSEDDTSGARPEQNPLNQTDNALDDSEDDTSGDTLDDPENDTSGAMPNSAVQRRKLRMIIDLEDDE